MFTVRLTLNVELFSCTFILLLRESDQCATPARLVVASHLSSTPRWGNPATTNLKSRNNQYFINRKVEEITPGRQKRFAYERSFFRRLATMSQLNFLQF